MAFKIPEFVTKLRELPLEERIAKVHEGRVAAVKESLGANITVDAALKDLFKDSPGEVEGIINSWKELDRRGHFNSQNVNPKSSRPPDLVFSISFIRELE